ncbi:oxidoreductase [Tepidibacter sp. Z1-5]|uniref:oxidoreductase n=1 Tax=Tepidibacter sp. Z1-5 TaxID=3134138 RepID=UPI0030BB43C3
MFFTTLVHQYDSKILMQIAYGRMKTTYNVGERVTNTLGKAMIKDEIDYIVDAFAKAGKRSKESRFEGVEIHGAHTYLLKWLEVLKILII